MHFSNELSNFSRLRYSNSSTLYLVDANSVSIGISTVSVNLVNNSTQSVLNLTIYALENDIFRVTIDETDFNRYHLEGVLDGEPPRAEYGFSWEIKNALFDKLFFFSIDSISLTGNITIGFGDGNKAIARASPLAIEFYKNDVLVALLNGDRFVVESVSIVTGFGIS